MPESKNKVFGIGVAVVLLMIAAAALGYQLLGGRQSGAGDVSRSAFFTDDNGKTFFKDDVNKLAPFDNNGKQALRCDVFKGSDGKEFVGLLYRYTDSGRKEMQGYLPNKSRDPDGSTRRSIEQRGMQVKKVGAPDKAWDVNDETMTAQLQTSMTDASGKPAKLVLPQ